MKRLSDLPQKFAAKGSRFKTTRKGGYFGDPHLEPSKTLHSRRVSRSCPGSGTPGIQSYLLQQPPSPTASHSRPPVPGTLGHHQSLLCHTFTSWATQIHQMKYSVPFFHWKTILHVPNLISSPPEAFCEPHSCGCTNTRLSKHLTLYLMWPWFPTVCLCCFTGCILCITRP